MSMKTSREGARFIGDFEGLFRRGGTSRFAPRGTNLASENPNKIYVYNDPIGLPTIGYGHLMTQSELNTGMMTIRGRSVNWRNGLTMEQVIDLKVQDLARFEDAVNRHVRVPITQSMFDSLISWTFNVGAGRIAPGGSTLATRLNTRQYRAAADELLRWDRAGGKVLPGLTRRREAERRMFLSEIHRVER